MGNMEKNIFMLSHFCEETKHVILLRSKHIAHLTMQKMMEYKLKITITIF